MSLFITFEGGEGSGKSTQAKLLYDRLRRSQIAAVLTREPGGTPVGDEVTRLLKWNDDAVSPLTELLLFNASRSQLVNDIINPALKDGKVVICDRFSDSTTVYQGYARGMKLKTVKAINATAAQGLKPDLTILLDLSVGEGFERRRAKKQDRFEKEGLAFHRKVRQGFLELAAEEPKRFFIIDAAQDKETIAEIVWQKISPLLPRGA